MIWVDVFVVLLTAVSEVAGAFSLVVLQLDDRKDRINILKILCLKRHLHFGILIILYF